MKRVQLQFPDNTSHTIDVVGLTYNPRLNMYVMQYHDITLHGNQNHMMYTYLEKVNNEFIRNPRLRQNIPHADAIGNLQIIDENICKECEKKYNCPCLNFCPAKVYEKDFNNILKPLNPSNCLHCKTCQRKCPFANIVWNVPEGGGGPKYKIS